MRRAAGVVLALGLSVAACSLPAEAPAGDPARGAAVDRQEPAAQRIDGATRAEDYRGGERRPRCARDRRFSVSPTASGRWLGCSGTGDGASAFVPDGGPRRAPLATLRHNIRALATVPRDLRRAGWISALEGEPDVVRSVRARDDGVVIIDVSDRARSLVDLHAGGRLGEMEEHLLRTVLAFDRSATLELRLDGSCAAYGDELISTEQVPQGCTRLTRADLRPATGLRG